MSLYLEIHHQVDGLTAEAVEAAHASDLEVQARYGVKYLKSWFDERRNKIFCLVEAPSKEAAIAVRRETHNLVADEVIEIR